MSTGRPNKTHSMTERQLASAVRQGRILTFRIVDEDFIIGYLAGIDDEAYFVLIPAKDGVSPPVKSIIFKTQLQMIDLGEQSFLEEPTVELMKPIVKPFRDWVNKEFFGEETRN